MFIVYFALWVILNGKWTTEIGVFGLVFAAVLYGFSCRFMGYSFKKDLHYLRRLPATLRYGATLLAEIFKANITVIRMILDRNFEPKPQLVHFESGLVELRHRVVLADSITLTPGTITCQLEGDRYLVHCLDEAMVDGLDNGVFVERLSEMEKKQKFMADSVTGEAELDGEKRRRRKSMSIETCYDVLTVGSLAVLVLLALVCLVRCILGPRISDRVMAVNMIGTLTIIMVVVFVVHLGEAYLADIALIYAMISFLSVVVLCKVYTGIYRERQHEKELLGARNDNPVETLVRDEKAGERQ